MGQRLIKDTATTWERKREREREKEGERKRERERERGGERDGPLLRIYLSSLSAS